MFDGIELRWSNFAPPETAAYAALPGLLLLRRSYPMGFTFLVWNVEKFRATNATRVRTVARHILDQQPDVFCILEFRGKNAARRLISS